MIEKIRPTASIKYDYIYSDYHIEYSCPTCGRRIGDWYGHTTACDKCGTFYDWGQHEPKIKITRSIEW